MNACQPSRYEWSIEHCGQVIANQCALYAMSRSTVWLHRVKSNCRDRMVRHDTVVGAWAKRGAQQQQQPPQFTIIVSCRSCRQRMHSKQREDQYTTQAMYTLQNRINIVFCVRKKWRHLPMDECYLPVYCGVFFYLLFVWSNRIYSQRWVGVGVGLRFECR